MEKISVLMNCYNSESYLKKAIDSVYSQTYDNWEIIFIDNCSTDNSARIAKGYDKRLKYIKTKKNIPLGSARKFGIKYCSNFVAILDTDDIWIENALEELYNSIISGDYSLAFGNQIIIDCHIYGIGL